MRWRHQRSLGRGVAFGIGVEGMVSHRSAERLQIRDRIGNIIAWRNSSRNSLVVHCELARRRRIVNRGRCHIGDVIAEVVESSAIATLVHEVGVQKWIEVSRSGRSVSSRLSSQQRSVRVIGWRCQWWKHVIGGTRVVGTANERWRIPNCSWWWHLLWVMMMMIIGCLHICTRVGLERNRRLIGSTESAQFAIIQVLNRKKVKLREQDKCCWRNHDINIHYVCYWWHWYWRRKRMIEVKK